MVLTHQLYENIKNYKEKKEDIENEILFSVVLPISFLMLIMITLLLSFSYFGVHRLTILVVMILLFMIIITSSIQSIKDNYKKSFNYLSEKQIQDLYDYIFNNTVNISYILDFIIENKKQFSPISIEKLQKYDFGKHYFIIKSYMYQNDIEKLRDILDIWKEYSINLNQRKFYISDPSSLGQIKNLIQDIEYIYKNRNVKKLPNLTFFVRNGKFYLEFQDLLQYYENLIREINSK